MSNNFQNSKIQDYEIKNIIGSGSFSSVYKVKRLIDKQEYAMKQVKIDQLNHKERQNSLNEVRILASINSQFIVKYRDAFFDENNLCLVMEYANGGDLLKMIKDNIQSNTFIEEETIWKILYDITNGLKVLHNLNIVHRDLKSANIFYNQKENIYKIGDLNVSKISQMGLVYTQAGTPYYSSPEVWKDQPYDKKCDIWSLGCILYELCMLRPPFVAKDIAELFMKIQKGQYQKISHRYSQQLQCLIQSFLQTNPSYRPNVNEILNNQTVIQKCYLINKQIRNEKENIGQQSGLLQTIKMQQNNYIIKVRFPKSNFNNKNNLIYDKENINPNQQKNNNFDENNFPTQPKQQIQQSLIHRKRFKIAHPQSANPRSVNPQILQNNLQYQRQQQFTNNKEKNVYQRKPQSAIKSPNNQLIPTTKIPQQLVDQKIKIRLQKYKSLDLDTPKIDKLPFINFKSPQNINKIPKSPVQQIRNSRLLKNKQQLSSNPPDIQCHENLQKQIFRRPQSGSKKTSSHNHNRVQSADIKLQPKISPTQIQLPQNLRRPLSKYIQPLPQKYQYSKNPDWWG